MIDENRNEGGGDEEASHTQQIPFPVMTKVKIRPNGNNVLIAWRKESMAGELHLPAKMTSLKFISAKVLATGPECKMVKEGDVVVVALKGLVNGEDGVVVDGNRLFFTQEPVIIAVVEQVKDEGSKEEGLTPTPQ